MIIDSRTPDAEVLFSDLFAQTEDGRILEVVMLEPDRDGINQLNELLAGRSDLSALHIISHGTDRGLLLGNGLVDQNDLDSQAEEIQGWASALTADGDIMLYGCDLASNSEGREFVDTLARLTNTDIAASTDPTGHESKGGDWDLEYRIGLVDGDVAFSTEAQQNWSGALAAPVITARETVDANADGQIDRIRFITDQALDDDFAGLTIDVDGYTVTSYSSDTPLDNIFYADLTQSGTPDTGATPTVTVTANTTLSNAGAENIPTDAGVAATDKAAPVILSARANAGSTTLSVIFSEAVDTSNVGAGDLVIGDVSYSNIFAGGATTISAMDDADGTDHLVTFTVDAAFVPGDSETDTIAAAANQIYDLADNAAGTSTVTISVPNTAPSFVAAGSGDGISIWDSSNGGDYGYGITLLDNGQYLIAGDTGTPDDFTLWRFNADGTLDTSFAGGAGYVATDFSGNNDTANNVEVLADGKFLILGTVNNGTDDDFGLARYLSDGSIDTSFGTGGEVTTDLGGTDDMERTAIQADGKIVVSGRTNVSGNNDYVVARYNTDGTLDTGFGGGAGYVTGDWNSGGEDRGLDILIQPDGKILITDRGPAAVVEGGDGSDVSFNIARYNTDGTLDTSFGGNGFAAFDIRPGHDMPYGLALQSDGKILQAGYQNTDLEVLVARWNSDGTVDTSFGGGNGYVSIDLGGWVITDDIHIQDDGKLVVTGQFQNADYDQLIMRLNADGTLDTSFGGGAGAVITDLGSGDDRVRHSSVMPDGKILVVGYSDNGTDNDLVMARYNSDGTLDTNFESVSTLDGAPTFTQGGAAVVLDADVNIRDTELDALNSGNGNYDGASITLVRNGGANAEDLFEFAAMANLTVVGATIEDTVSGDVIANLTNAGGQLQIDFVNTGTIATTALVNEVLQSVEYSINSVTPPASVQIDWTFNDGNTGAQGTGGALQVVGSTTVTIIATTALTGVSNAPSPNTVSDSSTHTVSFTTANPLPLDGKIVVTFPAGFDLTAVGDVDISSGTMDGSFTVSAAGQVLTITRSGGSAQPAAAEDIIIADITNTSTVGAGYTVTVATQDSGSTPINGPTVSSAFTIQGKLALANPDIQVTDRLGGTSGTQPSDVALVGFKLTPTGENASWSDLVVPLTYGGGMADADITNARIYVDLGTVGTYDSGVDTQVGAQAASAAGGALTWNTVGGTVTAATNYLIVFDTGAVLSNGETVQAGVTAGNITGTGVTTSASITASGDVANEPLHTVSGIVLTTTGAPTIGVGQLYTLNLSASVPVTSWTINWGDGAIDTFAGNPASVTHVYTGVGLTNNILASAVYGGITYFQNELVAASSINDKLNWYDNTGAPRTPAQSGPDAGLDYPLDPIIGPDGNVYVSGFNSGNVVRYNATTGAFIDEFITAGSGGLTAAYGMAFGPDGHLYGVHVRIVR